MPEEVVAWIDAIDPKVIIDGTYGGGGHSRLLLHSLPHDGVLIGIDRDPTVSERVEQESIDPRVTVFVGSYEQAPKALSAMELQQADAMLLDLGLSSDQLASEDRGFSYLQADAKLDLRFDMETGLSAADWLAFHKETEIADAIYRFGEERFSRRIAREIVARRRGENRVETVGDLVDVCRRCVPRSKNHDIHPATRTFQALRITVNDELGILQRTLDNAADWLNPGGRLVVISFHSLEDRLVKNAFRDDPRWNVLTKKPIRPSETEVVLNPRSRSAKLRVAERAPGPDDHPGS